MTKQNTAALRQAVEARKKERKNSVPGFWQNIRAAYEGCLVATIGDMDYALGPQDVAYLIVAVNNLPAADATILDLCEEVEGLRAAFTPLVDQIEDYIERELNGEVEDPTSELWDSFGNLIFEPACRVARNVLSEGGT